MNRAVLVVGLLWLASLVVIPVPATAATASIEVGGVASPSESLPGTSGSIAFTIKNVGAVTANSITVQRIDVQQVLINETGRLNLGALGPADSTTVTPYTFWVPPASRPGVYLAEFNLEYRYDDAGTTRFGNIPFSVPVTVRVPRALHVGPLEPSSLDPGTTQTLQLGLRNTGSTALSSIQAFWNNPDGVLLPLGQGTEVFVERLGANQSTSAPVEVAVPAGTAAGLYTISFAITYRDVSGVQTSTTATFAVHVETPSQISVALDEWAVDEVTLSVSNVGLGPATAVEIRIRDGPVDVRPAAAVYLGNLQPGDHTTATFSPAKTNGRDVPLQAVIAYTDPEGVRHETTYALDLGGDPPGSDGGGIGTHWIVGISIVVSVAGTYMVMRRRRS